MDAVFGGVEVHGDQVGGRFLGEELPGTIQPRLHAHRVETHFVRQRLGVRHRKLAPRRMKEDAARREVERADLSVRQRHRSIDRGFGRHHGLAAREHHPQQDRPRQPRHDRIGCLLNGTHGGRAHAAGAQKTAHHAGQPDEDQRLLDQVHEDHQLARLVVEIALGEAAQDPAARRDRRRCREPGPLERRQVEAQVEVPDLLEAETAPLRNPFQFLTEVRRKRGGRARAQSPDEDLSRLQPLVPSDDPLLEPLAVRAPSLSGGARETQDRHAGRVRFARSRPGRNEARSHFVVALGQQAPGGECECGNEDKNRER
ncbi:MAG: hypothetical protein ACYS0E_12450 [Planctomycetota bacterium]